MRKLPKLDCKNIHEGTRGSGTSSCSAEAPTGSQGTAEVGWTLNQHCKLELESTSASENHPEHLKTTQSQSPSPQCLTPEQTLGWRQTKALQGPWAPSTFLQSHKETKHPAVI